MSASPESRAERTKKAFQTGRSSASEPSKYCIRPTTRWARRKARTLAGVSSWGCVLIAIATTERRSSGERSRRASPIWLARIGQASRHLVSRNVTRTPRPRSSRLPNARAPGVVAKSELGQCDRPGGTLPRTSRVAAGAIPVAARTRTVVTSPRPTLTAAAMRRNGRLRLMGVAYRRGCGAAFA